MIPEQWLYLASTKLNSMKQVRPFFSFCFFMLPHFFAFSQAGEWTYMKGSTTTYDPGIYGVQGVADPMNQPPGLYEAVSWTDLDGNFWLFGGVGFSTFGDLWKYDVATGNWTWMKGTGLGAAGAIYGTQGVPNANNRPGSRAYGSIGWTDSTGNLWLFGGWGYDGVGGYGPMCDVWKYEIATNEWTWMQGPNNATVFPTYGTMGIPDPANTPGNRYEFNAAWQANDGTFWIYGGECSASAGTLNRSDVWKYDPQSNEWTWMQGPGPGSGYINPTYGTLGVPDAANTPGSRSCYAVAKDLNGKFWMTAGYQSFPSPVFSDVWMFDPDLLQWAWMGGNNVLNSNGTYNQLCDTITQNIPQSRHENRNNWSDACGNLWNYGGEINNSSGALHDLWVFDTQDKKWKWVRGDNTLNVSPNYGTILVSAPSNDPGGRSGMVTWTGADGSLWLFGGFDGSFGARNDLWRYIIDPDCVDLSACLANAPSFGVSDAQVCEKFCVDFFDSSANNPIAWLWEFPGAIPSSSTDQNPTNICYDNPGIFDVTLITTSATGNDTLTLTGYITVFDTPPFPTITQVDYTLTSSPATTYQWQFNSVDITGATNQSYTAPQTGFYTVVITDSNGCVNSATLYVLITGIEEWHTPSNLSIYPNPSKGNFTISFEADVPSGDVIIEIHNGIGQEIYRSSVETPGKNFTSEIALKNISPGIYFLEIKTEDHVAVQKIVITR
jgi:hypothetical protein